MLLLITGFYRKIYGHVKVCKQTKMIKFKSTSMSVTSCIKCHVVASSPVTRLVDDDAVCSCSCWDRVAQLSMNGREMKWNCYSQLMGAQLKQSWAKDVVWCRWDSVGLTACKTDTAWWDLDTLSAAYNTRRLTWYLARCVATCVVH